MDMTLHRFVALDVEVASRSPARICAIGVARFEAGREVCAYRSLVQVDGVVRFSSIHGLTRRDLAKAPAWPEVWAGVLDILGDVRTVVAFRASFDRGAILAMSARHGVRLPRLQFVCAAEMIEARYGLRASLSTSLEALGLQFPGSPHDPLADARAGAMVALACLAPSPTPAQAR